MAKEGAREAFLHMGSACGKWSEAAACVPTSEAGLRIRWCTVMDTAAASPFTKVTLAAASGPLSPRRRQLFWGRLSRRRPEAGSQRCRSARLGVASYVFAECLSLSLSFAVPRARCLRARPCGRSGWVGRVGRRAVCCFPPPRTHD